MLVFTIIDCYTKTKRNAIPSGQSSDLFTSSETHVQIASKDPKWLILSPFLILDAFDQNIVTYFIKEVICINQDLLNRR